MDFILFSVIMKVLDALKNLTYLVHLFIFSNHIIYFIEKTLKLKNYSNPAWVLGMGTHHVYIFIAIKNCDVISHLFI